MYEFLKAIHLTCIILFVGTVFFRTLVILKLLSVFTKEEGQKIQQAIGNKARGIIKINNIILIISGLLVLFLYANTSSIILNIKVLLGLILVIGFYFVPLLFTKLEANARFKTIFHYLFFSLLILVVFLSQYIYSF
jgi:uncharacterized protein